MNKQELQQIKRAWVAAEESGNTQEQTLLICRLNDHPDAQTDLIDFIAGYRATEISEPALEIDYDDLLPLTQRATQSAFTRVFGTRIEAHSLVELRNRKGFTLITAARGLHLSIEVWKKFETGSIELASLGQRQLEHFANFFQVSVDQFGSLLINSQPTPMLNRRQTSRAARHTQQGPRKQSFQTAILKSTMSEEEKKFWLHLEEK